MANSFELVDNAMHGALELRLRRMREDGWSMQKIAQTFTDEGFPVSRETIRRWLDHLKLPLRGVA
jgi:hypothetical protein